MTEIPTLRRFLTPLSHPRELADIPPKDISLVVSALLQEQTTRPELVEELGRFPILLGEYFTFSKDKKECLAQFQKNHDKYLSGGDTGDGLGHFPRQYRDAQLLAQRCRYSSQLLTLFDFYYEHSLGKSFNHHYMMYDKPLQEKHHTQGIKLLDCLRKNHFITMSEIVDIVANVRPEIILYYRPPQDCYRKIASVTFVDFKQKR